jgi:tripartite-type tricarboxylate transporter receptor subunit TctC
VTTATRTKRFPDLPTLAEVGVTGYESGAWYGFVVPKGTPAPIVDKIRTATIEAINTSIVRERFANEGADPLGIAPDKFAEMMQKESARWAEVVKNANIEMN